MPKRSDYMVMINESVGELIMSYAELKEKLTLVGKEGQLGE